MTGEVERRLRALEDEREILRTLYRYGHSLDYGAEAEWVDCFTQNGVYELRYRDADTGGRPTRYEGHAELEKFARGHSRAPDRYHKHLVVEPVIEVVGDEAAVTSYFLRVDAEGGERRIYAFGRYIDHLVREADGCWRFTCRLAEIESRAAVAAPRRVP